MRVANRSIYELTSYRLGQSTVPLYRANGVIASGKRINSKPIKQRAWRMHRLAIKGCAINCAMNNAMF